MYFVITDENNYMIKIELNDLPCYFVDKENIHTFYSFGFWIRPVVALNNSKIIKRWNLSADKLIVGNRFQLYSLKTIKKFNLNITDLYISEVCKRGKVNILEWWKNSGLELKYSACALTFASKYCQVEVLEWWKNSGLELKYNERALHQASLNGQVKVLQWWFNSGLELKYDTTALNGASENGHINVLEWWKNSGLELKYNQDTYALNKASENGHINVLEWWKNSGLELKYTTHLLDWVFLYGQVEVLEWWKNSGLIK